MEFVLAVWIYKEAKIAEIHDSRIHKILMEKRENWEVEGLYIVKFKSKAEAFALCDVLEDVFGFQVMDFSEVVGNEVCGDL